MELPNEITLHILEYVPSDSILSASSICTLWRDLLALIARRKIPGFKASISQLDIWEIHEVCKNLNHTKYKRWKSISVFYRRHMYNYVAGIVNNNISVVIGDSKFTSNIRVNCDGFGYYIYYKNTTLKYFYSDMIWCLDQYWLRTVLPHVICKQLDISLRSHEAILSLLNSIKSKYAFQYKNLTGEL